MRGQLVMRRAAERVGVGAGVLLVMLFALFPFYWAMNASLERPEKLFVIPASYVPVPPSLESYRKALTDATFLISLRNSAIVATSATALALAMGSLAACALGRWRMRGRRAALGLILAMTMFPQISILGALHAILTRLGLYNRLGGLVLSYMLITLPLTVWVLTNFFRTLPLALEESAYVDGATPFQTFRMILLPLALPGLAATGLLTFIAAWNEYLYAQSFTITQEARTVPVTIANFSGATVDETPWGTIMAACVIVTVPLVALVLVLQRRLVEGLTSGAVKG